jgi:hypothetical protein
LEGRWMQRATHNSCFLQMYVGNMSSNSTVITRIAVIMMVAIRMLFCRNCNSCMHYRLLFWTSKWGDTRQGRHCSDPMYIPAEWPTMTTWRNKLVVLLRTGMKILVLVTGHSSIVREGAGFV